MEVGGGVEGGLVMSMFSIASVCGKGVYGSEVGGERRLLS